MWFRDSAKLLDKVIEHARHDPAFASRLLAEVADLSKRNPRMKAQLRELLKGAKRGAVGVPYWQHVLLLKDYALCTQQMGMSRTDALDWLAERWGLSVDRIEKRLQEARRAVSIESIPTVT